jgi:hypothetical protein
LGHAVDTGAVSTTPWVSILSARGGSLSSNLRVLTQLTLKATSVGAPDQDITPAARPAAKPARTARAVSCALFFALIAAVSAPGQAQDADEGRWLVLASLVATHGDPKHPTRAAARAISEELREADVRALRTDEAKTLFEQHGSTPPMTASAADIDELAKDAQRALYHVASGLPQRAKKDVERALERARRALESLNRETRASQHLLDACLYLVRAHLQHGDRAEARQQALECRRLVPDARPESTVHPPDVIGVLAEAQAQLRSHEPAALRIESEPTGCAAYVNGRNLGPTPRELSALSPGEYRIQVECESGVMGRVHRVGLSTSRVVTKVDTRYDHAIETLFDISLHYSAREQEKKHLSRDAVETARIVGASNVVVASLESMASPSRAQVRLDRYRVADGVHIAQTTLSVDSGTGTIAGDLLDRARKELLEPATSVPPARVAIAAPATTPTVQPEHEPEREQRPELVVREPQPEAVEDYEEPEGDGRGPDAWTTVGYVAGGLGLVAHAAGWIAYGSLLDKQSAYTSALNQNQMPRVQTAAERTALDDINSADDLPIVFDVTGAVLSSGALPLWLPKSDGIPWWGWVSGGAGLGLAITGAVLQANASSCELDRYQRCTEPAHATDLGPMLLLQSAPFLAVPVVQGIRMLTDERASVGVNVGAQRALITLEGQW